LQTEPVKGRLGLWAGFSLAGCALLVLFSLLDMFPMMVVSKLLASSAFVLLAIKAGALQHRVGQWMFAALVLSWIGDMLLLDKVSGLFMPGLVSFLLAHVAYVSAFAMKGVSKRWLMMVSFPVLLISLLASMWMAPHVPPDMVIPVRAYTIVISVMVIMAIGAWGAGATVLIPVGAALFYFSDLSVAAGQFVQTEFPNYVWGLPFYYIGQVLLALSAGPVRGPARTP
jgi:uncharacterized membrane protein YhhN